PHAPPPVAGHAALGLGHRAHSWGPSGSSGCFRSHSGRRLVVTGTVSKLYGGGGEVVAHSSVQASHGSSPAGAPCRSDTRMFTTKISTAAIWTGTPSVVMRFHISQP